MKLKVIEQLVLALPCFNKLFQIDFHASGNSFGVILSQEGTHGPYFSKKLNDANIKYFFYD